MKIKSIISTIFKKYIPRKGDIWKLNDGNLYVEINFVLDLDGSGNIVKYTFDSGDYSHKQIITSCGYSYAYESIDQFKKRFKFHYALSSNEQMIKDIIE